MGGGGTSVAGGGGGRIALYYGDKSGFTGQVSAKGGVGRDGSGAVGAVQSGGAGTIYWKQASEAYGELVVDNGGQDTVGWSTPVVTPGAVTLDRLTLNGCARLQVTNGLSVTQQLILVGTNQLAVGAGFIFPSVVVGPGKMDLTLTAAGAPVFGDLPFLASSNFAFMVNGDALFRNSVVIGGSNVAMTVIGNATFQSSVAVHGSNVAMTVVGNASFTDVVVSNGALLTLSGTNRLGSLEVGRNGVVTTVPQVGLNLAVTGEVWVAVGGVLDARAKGWQDPVGYAYDWGNGPGYGRSQCGANYGGLGGLKATDTTRYYGWVYDTLFDPQQPGSSGRAVGAVLAHGGGLIRLAAQRLVVDGVVRADASELIGQSTVGAGSGGGIRLDVGVLVGGGVITADGGGNRSGGGGTWVMGGGGGRVAIYYGDKSAFSGQASAKGGVGRDGSGAVGALQSGGAGTIYLRQANEPYGELIIDNGGHDTLGWSTPIPVSGIWRLDSFTVEGGARVSTPASLRILTGNPASFTSLISSNYLQVNPTFDTGRGFG